MPKIRVPQKDGEVRVSVAGDPPTVYKVTDGEVTVPADDAERFLAAVDGSSIVGGSPSGKEK